MRDVMKGLRSALLIVVVLGLTLTGCANGAKDIQGTPTPTPGSPSSESTPAPTDSGEPDISKEVKLSMWLTGDGTPDEALVYEELNKMLKQDINATVKVNHFTWSDWTTKYNLLMSSAEDFDIIFAATWTEFANYARRGAFYEITEEVLEKYAPETAKYAKDVLVSGMVDGKLFGLPAKKKEFSTACYIVRGDLMKKYGINEINSFEDFGVYLEAVAKNEEGIIPYNISGDESWALGQIIDHNRQWTTMGAAATASTADPERKVFYALEKPEYLESAQMMRDWAQKGYWSKNALSNRTPARDSFKAGTSAAAIVNLNNANQMYLELKKTHPEWDVKVFNALNQKTSKILSYMANGMAVYSKSKNPERALMLLDLLKNNEEYNMLTNYGIKGVHYEITADGKANVIAPEKYSEIGAAPWGWNNEDFVKVNTESLPNYTDIYQYYEENYVEDPLREFNPDISSITDVDAAIQDLNRQYGTARSLGFVEKLEESIQDSVKKAKDAGLDRYLVEIQKQIDAYLAQYKEMTN